MPVERREDERRARPQTRRRRAAGRRRRARTRSSPPIRPKDPRRGRRPRRRTAPRSNVGGVRLDELDRARRPRGGRGRLGEHAADRSSPVTRDGRRRASSTAWRPVPQPMSQDRAPARQVEDLEQERRLADAVGREGLVHVLGSVAVEELAPDVVGATLRPSASSGGRARASHLRSGWSAHLGAQGGRARTTCPARQRPARLRAPAVKRIVLGDNLDVLRAPRRRLRRASSTSTRRSTPGKVQERTRAAHRARRRTATAPASTASATAPRCWAAAAWHDAFDDYLGFLAPRLAEARRILAADGSLFFHIDTARGALLQGAARRALRARVVHQRDRLGLRLRRAARARAGRPSTTPSSGTRATPRATSSTTTTSTACPYMAPGLVGPEKAARGKTPTDVWWHTIVSPTGKEKTGYPTQKPLRILERIVRVHSDPGDLVVDFFAGSGTTGEAAARLRPRLPAGGREPRGRARHGASAWRGTGRRSWRLARRPALGP